MAPARRSGADLGQRVVARQKLAAPGQIIGIQQTLGRHRHEVAVGHVAAAIGEGQARGIADQPPAFRVVGPQAGQIIAAKRAQNLPYGQPARRRGAHAADFVVAVFDADRRTFDHLVARQILGRQDARIALGVADRGNDVLCDFAGIEGTAAVGGDAAQGLGIGGVLQGIAGRDGSAAGKEVIGGRAKALQRLAFLGDQRGQARRHVKAVLGQIDGGTEQPAPIGLAPAAMRLFQQRRRARRADRPSADHRLHEFQRLAVLVLKQRRRGLGGGGLAGIQRRDLAAFGVIPDQEGPAAEARALRFDQTQHGLNRDHGVGGAAAGLQHLGAGLHRQRVGGRHHPVRRRDGLARLFRIHRGAGGLAKAGKSFGGGLRPGCGRGFGIDAVGGLLGHRGHGPDAARQKRHENSGACHR